jgi:hypothetical protein
MKRFMLYLVLLSGVFCSCKKEHFSNNVQKTYKVQFNISGFTQTTIGSNAAKKPVTLALNTDTSVAAYSSITAIVYAVYDSNGNQVRLIKQDSSSANFGTISDNLPTGNYTVLLAGGGNNLTLYNSVYSANQIGPFSSTDITYFSFVSYLGNLTPWGSHLLPWKDTFFKMFPLTISNSNLNQTVALSRIVGQLEVNINDALPANAKTFIIKINKEIFAYSASKTTPDPQTAYVLADTAAIPASAIGTNSFKIYSLIGNTNSLFNVTISCYDASNLLIQQATVDSVNCIANERTILSGNLFGSSDSFTMSLNAAWNPTTINVPFSRVTNKARN